MVDNFKKYWFVIIIGLIFVVFIGWYSIDQVSSVFKGKTVDGKQVVSEIKNENYFVDDYFSDLQDSVGDAQLYALFQKAVLRSIETPADVVTSSKENAKSYLDYIAQQNGQAGIEQVDSILVSLGYSGSDELNLYYEDMAKYNTIITEYVKANSDKYLDEYVKTFKPRVVSHILVKMEDAEKPTEEQQKKIDSVNERIKKGDKFADIATALSDDSGSAVNGGLIGFTDVNSQLVPEFLKAALDAKEGEVTAWVNTTYGRHLIKVDTTDINELMDKEYNADFVDSITTFNSDLSYEAIWAKAKDLKIEFGSDDIKTRLINFIDIEGVK